MTDKCEKRKGRAGPGEELSHPVCSGFFLQHKSWSVGAGRMQFVWHLSGFVCSRAHRWNTDGRHARTPAWRELGGVGRCDFRCWTSLTDSEHKHFWGCASARHFGFFCAYILDLIFLWVCNVSFQNRHRHAAFWLSCAGVSLASPSLS